MTEFPSSHETKMDTQMSDALTQLKSPRTGMIISALCGATLLGGALWWFMSGESPELAVPVAAAPAVVEPAPLAATPPVVQKKPVPVLPDTVLFAVNDATLNQRTKADLDLWVERLASDKTVALQIDGHCDERGTKMHNKRLGERRARAAKGYLVSKGVESQRVYTASYGKSRPLAKGHSEDAWAKNRRVELYLKTGGTALSQR
jgi:peptidoglycan-associated lipoprotein